MKNTNKPQNKAISHKDYTIKLSRLYDNEGYGFTEATIFSKDGKVVFFEKSTVLNPLSELVSIYKEKLDGFISTKFPKLSKATPTEVTVTKRGRPKKEASEILDEPGSDDLSNLVLALQSSIEKSNILCQKINKLIKKK